VKKLFGRTDLEDALKRLGKLTQEEARMATAEVLKVTHTVDNRVRRVADNVVDIENQVTGVNDRVTGVDRKVAGVDERVRGVDARVTIVDDRVKTVDEKVTVVINGAQTTLSHSLKQKMTLNCQDGNEAKQVIQQTADAVNQVKRLSYSNLSGAKY